MIDRTTAEAALEAFQRTAAARRGYGKPIDAAMALTSHFTGNDFLLLGLYWLVVADADKRQLDAAWELLGVDPAAKAGPPPPHIAAVLRGGADVLPLGTGGVTIVRLALACLDQGDMFRRVTPARLVEVLCWEEEQPS